MTTDNTVQDDADNGDRLVTVPTVRTEFGELSGWALVPRENAHLWDIRRWRERP